MFLLFKINVTTILAVQKQRDAFSCADPESFPRGGPAFFLFDEARREDPNFTTISVPTSASQRNAIAFRWRADDGPTWNAGLVAL